MSDSRPVGGKRELMSLISALTQPLKSFFFMLKDALDQREAGETDNRHVHADGRTRWHAECRSRVFALPPGINRLFSSSPPPLADTVTLASGRAPPPRARRLAASV